MTIIGIDGCQIFVRMPHWEYQKMVKALADMDDDNPEKE